MSCNNFYVFLGEIVLNEEDPLLVGSKITKKRKLEGVIYPCDKCDYTATYRGNLNKHINSKHEGVRYPCEHCGYVATQAVNLQNRIKSWYKGLRYLKMMICYSHRAQIIFIPVMAGYSCLWPCRKQVQLHFQIMWKIPY